MTEQTLTQGALDKNPENLNMLDPHGFLFQIKKLPNVNFYMQTVDIPDINLPEAIQHNPFVDIKHPGNKLSFSDLVISFKIDEDLSNYIELNNWIMDLGFPKNTQDYGTLAKNPSWTGLGLVSDASIIATTDLKNPNIEFVFQDCWPTRLGNFQLTTTMRGMEYISCQATFKYLRFTILPLPKA